ncbi:NTP transferase domain-containing protein, partial [Candidatus Gottesmanbacteria bacterium]|nr:NTP transferase domain-containing protein [Candidatus Gottesmanbacteria bacterium]
MQAVILAAGASTRFCPLADDVPKCMIPLLGKPILEWTVSSLAKMGIGDIILVTPPAGVNITTPPGCEPKVVVQGKPLGMANALLCAKKFIKEDFLLLHGYHLDVGDFIKPMVEKKRNSEAVLLAEERQNFWEYGVLELENERAKGLVEKPAKSQELTKECVVGIYLLTPDFIPLLEKIPSSHYQLEMALDKWMKMKNIEVVRAQKPPVSLKYPWDLLEIKNYLLEKVPHQISRGAKIGKGVILVGKMIIEEGAT